MKEDDFGIALATKAKLEWIEEELQVDAEDEEELKSLLPAQLAVSQQVYPLSLENGELHLVCYDPLN